RFLYEHFPSSGQGEFRWNMHGSGPIKKTLNTTGLTANGTVTPSSDSRLKFISKSVTNGLTVINRLEPVEYDQIYELVDQYTPDTPQSHQCGCIAQSVEQIDELRHAVVGGTVGKDDKESLRGLNYNAVFTYAVTAIQ
ncbi:MAG: tail fiber domain-containing protein, partial [Candidatus Fonsibacter sp.]